MFRVFNALCFIYSCLSCYSAVHCSLEKPGSKIQRSLTITQIATITKMIHIISSNKTNWHRKTTKCFLPECTLDEFPILKKKHHANYLSMLYISFSLQTLWYFVVKSNLYNCSDYVTSWKACKRYKNKHLYLFYISFVCFFNPHFLSAKNAPSCSSTISVLFLLNVLILLLHL